MRPLDQQTILVTGATDGLGRALAQDLAARGATVLLHGRSADRLARATQEIRQATHNYRLRVYRADFASLEAVRGLAREIERDQPRLDVLVNNRRDRRGGGGWAGRDEGRRAPAPVFGQTPWARSAPPPASSPSSGARARAGRGT